MYVKGCFSGILSVRGWICICAENPYSRRVAITTESIKHPKGFRARRGLNWAFIGLLYTSFYMCRYNLSLANKSISHEFGFTREQMGDIITTALLAYAFGQIINGLLADRIGGKKAMLIGAAGTIVMNILFGVASFAGMLGLFVAIRGIDGYLQAFGAPGMVKINTAWFAHRERGRFSGIFGFMINLGRIGIFTLGPALLTGFAFFGLLHIPPMHWRWLFWAPSIICAVAATAMALTAKDTPEEAGWVGVIADDTATMSARCGRSSARSLRAILTNPVVWVTAFAYACTGAVRQSVDQWFPRYMQDSYKLDLNSVSFYTVAILIPIVASMGSLLSGYASDIIFKGRRAPVAAMLYFLETAIILLAAQFHTVDCAIIFFAAHFLYRQFHPFHSWQRRADGHWRAAFCGLRPGVDRLVPVFRRRAWPGIFSARRWTEDLGNYFYFMAPFGVIGGVLMLTILGKVTRGSGTPAPAAEASA